MSDPQKYYTPHQVANIFQVDVQTVRKWLREGLLGGIKIGPRRWRISQAQLDTFARWRAE